MSQLTTIKSEAIAAFEKRIGDAESDLSKFMASYNATRASIAKDIQTHVASQSMVQTTATSELSAANGLLSKLGVVAGAIEQSPNAVAADVSTIGSKIKALIAKNWKAAALFAAAGYIAKAGSLWSVLSALLHHL